jgi:hypothetical protein
VVNIGGQNFDKQGGFIGLGAVSIVTNADSKAGILSKKMSSNDESRSSDDFDEEIMQENMDRLMSKFHPDSSKKDSNTGSNNNSDSKSFNKNLFISGNSAKNRPEPLKLLAFKQHFKGGGSNRKISLNAVEDIEKSDIGMELNQSVFSKQKRRMSAFDNA